MNARKNVFVARSFALGLALLGAASVFGQPAPVIVRGPYLQSATTSNIIVRWRTDLPTESRVRFGTVVSNLTLEVSDPTPTTDHAVALPGLVADSKYFYAIAAGIYSLAGGPSYAFTTLPVAPKPTRIWAIGDVGTASFGSSAPLLVRDAYASHTGSRSTDVWLMLGDNAYYSGTDAEYQAAVFDVFQDLLRTTPVWPTLGNHETYGASPAGQMAYDDIFDLPQDGRAGGLPSGSERYYSFDYGNIHFVSLDSELAAKTAGGPMLTWLEQDLAATESDWIIAFWHSPPYSKGSHDSDFEANLVGMREQVVPVLETYGVDLVLCGHSHNYERSFLLNGHYGSSPTLTSAMVLDAGSGRSEETGAYNKSLDGPDAGRGAVYVVAGSAGQTGFGSFDHPAMFIARNDLGSLVIDIDGQRLDAKFLRENGQIEDQFSIFKGDQPPSIVTQPADRTTVEGATASFNVVVAGTRPLSYQWRFNDNPIADETNAVLTLNNVSAAQAGQYSVVVSNPIGSVTSAEALLTVNPATVESTYDLSRDFSPTINPNGVWSFGAKASLGGPLSFFGIRGSNPFEYWQLVPSQEPTIYRNGTPNTITIAGGQGIFPPKTVFYYSGSNGASNGFGVVRFSPPVAGSYAVHAEVAPVFDGNSQGDTDFHVVKNGAELFGRFLAPADHSSYANILTLDAGDMLDFMVGRGQDNNGTASGLKIQVTISAAEAPPPHCVPAASGLVGWWPLEGNATDLVGVNDGTLSGDPAFGGGEVGQALVFDGINDRLRVPTSPAIDVGAGAGFTIEGWIKPAELSHLRPIAEWNNGGPGVHFWSGVDTAIAGDGERSLFANLVDVSGASHQIRTARNLLGTGIWQHVALSYDKASGQGAIYFNGGLVTQAVLGTFTPRTTGDLYFGNRPSGPVSGTYWAGGMDEMGLYARALAAPEIVALYAAGAAGKCNGPQTPPAGLVFNGSFELGIEPGLQIDAPNSTAITGWTVVAGNIDYVGPSLWVAGDGARCLDLSGASAGTISQTISGLIVSQRYELSFLMAVNPDAPPPSTELLVSVGGISNRFSMRTAGTRSNLGWHEQRLEFTASSGATVLQFASLNPGWAGPVLDRVAMIVATNAPPPPPSGLVANGSFELGIDPGVGVQINSPDSGAITGWLVQNGNLDYVGTGWMAGDGSRSLDLSGTAAGTISQVVTGLTLGQSYRLSFLMAGNPGLIPPFPAIKRLRASIGPNSQDYSFDATGFSFANMGWAQRALDFTANESSLTLSFMSLTDGLGGPALDNVAIQAIDVPPPGTNCVSISAGLVGWWPLEGNGADVFGSNNGTLSGSPAFVGGKVGQAMRFDGVNDFVRVSANAAMNVGAGEGFAIEGWINPSDLSHLRPIAEWNSGSIGAHFWAGVDSAAPGDGTRNLSANLVDTSGGYHGIHTAAGLVSVGVWQHVALTYDKSSGQAVIYYNGGVAAQASLGSFTPLTSGDLYFGSRPSGPFSGIYWSGGMDELSLYSRALSQAEVQAIVQAGGAGKCITPVAPHIIAGPQNRTVTRGSTVVFSVGASGTAPLSYQWFFNDSPIDGANASTLTLYNVQLSQSGNYSVTASNALGTATSDHAVLVVNPPPATVRVVNANGAGAAEVSVPVELLANGNENALGFSLNFNANVMGFVGASLGLGAPSGATLLVNTNEVAAGRLGLVVGLPADEVFAEGTQQVALVTFLVAPILNQTTVAISFGDQPTLRQLSDDRAEELPAVFVNGIASIADSQFEGDVAPRPNGNRSVATIDWVQMGRFVARLDTISSPNEFQRADCAPRATKGNGLLTVSDWVQAGRYAVGLDPLTVLGGPTEPDGGGAGGFAAASATSSRQLGVVSTSIAQGQTNVVSVTLDCHGNENAASFSVVFDQTKLAFVSAAPGAGSAGSLLNLNTSQTAQGRLGVALAAQPGRTFAAGSREILQLRFSALASAPATVTLSFGNAPVPLEVSDVAANPLPADFAAGAVSVTPPPGPPLRITRSGNSLFITWPSSATGFELEATEGALGTAWSQVPGVISLGEQKLAIINTGGHERYFRLKKP